MDAAVSDSGFSPSASRHCSGRRPAAPRCLPIACAHSRLSQEQAIEAPLQARAKVLKPRPVGRVAAGSPRGFVDVKHDDLAGMAEGIVDLAVFNSEPPSKRLQLRRDWRVARNTVVVERANRLCTEPNLVEFRLPEKVIPSMTVFVGAALWYELFDNKSRVPKVLGRNDRGGRVDRIGCGIVDSARAAPASRRLKDVACGSHLIVYEALGDTPAVEISFDDDRPLIVRGCFNQERAEAALADVQCARVQRDRIPPGKVRDTAWGTSDKSTCNTAMSAGTNVSIP